MNKILITGATGNIGTEVIKYLYHLNKEDKIIVGARNVDKAKKKFNEFTSLEYREFDFENQSVFDNSFKKIDVLFLLRPPHISDVDAIFKPLLIRAKKNKINKIVFLSVQGAEKSKVIPHNKIERLVQKLEFNYIFVRPSYFMQNLTTTLITEIREQKTITLPSGKAKFNWIDTQNIGEATAVLITSFDKFQNKSFEITGTENKSFGEVTQIMSDILPIKIRFHSMNPVRFYLRKRKEGLTKGYALVMTILHFLPRLQKEPKISNNFTVLTNKTPTTLSKFIEREKEVFLKF